MTRQYKILFTGFLHPASMTTLKSQFKQSNEIIVIENYPSNSEDLIKTLIVERPDVIIICNDTLTIHTKISLLLNIPKIRFQEDPPQNPKWRESFLYDLKSPLSYIHTGFDISSFGEIPKGKLMTELINSEDVAKYSSSASPPLTDYFWDNPLFIRDKITHPKDIDIVFVGNLGDLIPENLEEEIERRFSRIPKVLQNKISDKITYHSTEFHAELNNIEDIIKGLDADVYNSLLHFYYEAIGRLRRINTLRFIVREFGERYNIHFYGHANMAGYISQKHYRGYLYDNEAVKDVYRRSKIAIYTNSRPPLYNYDRFLEPYRFECVGIADYIAMSSEEFEKLHMADIIRIVPKVKHLNDLQEIIPYYINDANRILLVDKLLTACSPYSKVNITPFIHSFMCLLEYISANKNISPYDLEMLKFDSEVIFLCEEIADCYLKISDNKNAERFKDLGGYFLDILRDNVDKSPEMACEYAYYYYRIKKYSDALRIIDELCTNLDRAIILKAKIYEKNKDYQKIIDTLLDFKTDDAKLMAEGFFLLGLALHNLSRFYDALEMFKKVEEMSPYFPEINYYLGNTAACMNDAHTAKKYLQEAFRRTKNFADIRILLGDTYFVLNEYDEAIKFYEHARRVICTYEKNKEKEITVIERLSMCYLYKKDFSRAAGALNFIIEEFDREHVNAHVKLFLILLITNTTTGDLWDRELSFIKNRQIDVKSVYNRIKGDFPPAIANVIDIDIKGL